MSDLHIGMSRNKEEENNFQVIVDSLLMKGQNDWKENKPLVLLTGDIVDDGNED